MAIKIHGKDYVLVNERLMSFLSENPKATIETQLYACNQIIDTSTGDPCNEYIVLAKIYPLPQDEPDIYYTGLAAERDNNGFINKTSALENAETSAVGRALAFAGYGSDESIASAEEVVVAQNKQKTFNPTVTSLDKLDRSMNECKSLLLLDDDFVKRYRAKRTAGMTKVQVQETQLYFDKIISSNKKEGGTNDKKSK
tara:strand:- start:21830 stop:22423 length:594 start_codon:yes stop_codon:yes gene_type:complete